jgi:hypothetical protein
LRLVANETQLTINELKMTVAESGARLCLLCRGEVADQKCAKDKGYRQERDATEGCS